MAKNKKNSVNKSSSSAKKFEAELPEIAKRHNIRVSNPYGYYPEDVDKVIMRLEKDISDLTKENLDLAKQIDQAKTDLSKMTQQFNSLKFQMISMEMPETSDATDFANLSRISNFSGKNEPQIQDKVSDGLSMPVGVVSEPHDEQKQQKISHNNLVKPKLKINNKGE